MPQGHPEYKATTANGDTTVKPGEKRKLTDEQRLFLKTLNAELQKANRFFISAERLSRDEGDETGGGGVQTGGEHRRQQAPSFTMQRCRATCRALADFPRRARPDGALGQPQLHRAGENPGDKRSNLSLRSPFLVSVLQQPFYSTEVLTQLITKQNLRLKLNALIASRGNEAELNGETDGHIVR